MEINKDPVRVSWCKKLEQHEAMLRADLTWFLILMLLLNVFSMVGSYESTNWPWFNNVILVENILQNFPL